MANGPRVFYVHLIHPIPGMMDSHLSQERKLSARGPKSAAEVFIASDYSRALIYKPGVVRVGVREQGSDEARVFAISTTVTAREIRASRKPGRNIYE